MTSSVLIDVSTGMEPALWSPPRTQVAISELVIYQFYNDPTSSRDICYVKTTDGGLTWSTPISIFGVGTGGQWHDIYYERWNGDAKPNVVHIAYAQDFLSRGIWYNSLNLDSDTLGTPVRALAMGPHPGSRAQGLGVARDGTIRVDGEEFSTPDNGAYSIDDGATWVTTGNAFAENDDADQMTVWADFAGDAEDLIAVFYDASAKQFSVKRWDKSAGTVTETAIGTVTSYLGYATALDKSSGHIYLAYFDVTGTIAIKTWDLYGATATARTNVLTGVTYSKGVALAIKPDGKIRCYYGRDNGAASDNSLEVYYKESSNSMTSWGTETLYSSRSARVARVVVDPSPTGGIAAAWQEDDGDGVHGNIYIEAPAPTVEPDQYRLMLSDGVDPDVPVLNITADNIPGSPLIKVERGRESAVLGMTPRAGQATLKLKNTGMAYSLDEPTPGLALRLNKMLGGVWYHLWQGNLDMPSHRMANWRPEAQLRALGTLTKLAGRKVSTELYKNITTGEAIGHLLDAAGFPSAMRDLDPGDVTLPYWWLSDEDAQSALWAILASEGITAEIYEDGQGRITFRSRSARYSETRSTAIQSTFYNTGTVNPLLTEFDYEAGHREVINYASHDRYRRTDDVSTSVVWEDVPDFYYIVPPNGSITVEARATEPFFDAITPVASTDFLYGFDAPTVTLERTSGQRTKITFTSGAGGTTLTALQLRGTATINNATYTEISSIDNTASVAAYGLRPWSGSMSKELDFATMRDNLDAIVSFKQLPRGRVTVSINAAQSAEANTATALREIGDRVRVVETNLDFDGECWIEHISHEVHAPAGPTDGSVVGSEVTTYECSVIVVAGGSLGTGLGATNPYDSIDNSVYVGTTLEDEGITMMGASIFG